MAEDIEHIESIELSITDMLESNGTMKKAEDSFFALLGVNDAEQGERMQSEFDKIFNESLGIGEDTEEA